MTLALPPIETLQQIQGRLRANDVTWFRDRHRAGDLAWLRDLFPPGVYDELGARVDAGDLDWLRLRLVSIEPFKQPGLSSASLTEDRDSFGSGPAARATSSVKGVGVRAAIASAAPRNRGVRIVAALALGAVLSGTLLVWLYRDDATARDTSLADLTVATATDSSASTPDASVTTNAATTEAAPASVASVAAVTSAATADVLATLQAAGSFGTLTSALDAAGITDSLQVPGPFTLFAPTDAAFAALPSGVLDVLLKPENRANLAKVLSYHVLAGTVAANAVKDGSVVTLEGSSIEAAHVDGKLVVNGVNVTTADVEASNGFIQVIDAVLIPPTVDVPSMLGDVPASVAVTDTTLPTAADVASTNTAGDPVSERLTVYFASGSAALDGEAQAKIDGAAITLAALPAGASVDLVGHASPTGNAAFNQQLSERRAATVERALKDRLDSKATEFSFTSRAKGDTETMVDQATSRRVTIEITSPG